jgi:hypothetical protein
MTGRTPIFARIASEDNTLVTVKALGAAHRSQRVWLELDVLDGDEESLCFRQEVTVGSSVCPWVLRSLAVPARLSWPQTARSLIGGQGTVRLRECSGGGVEVWRWVNAVGC